MTKLASLLVKVFVNSGAAMIEIGGPASRMPT